MYFFKITEVKVEKKLQMQHICSLFDLQTYFCLGTLFTKCEIVSWRPALSTNFAKSYTKVKLIGHRCHTNSLLLLLCTKHTGANCMTIGTEVYNFIIYFGSENTMNCYRFGQKSESFKSHRRGENILDS